MTSNTPPPPPQQPPSTTTTTTAPNPNPNRDQFLRHLTHLNKLSHRITKPTHSHHTPTPPPPQQPPQQPPVYNISKSEFRDVVQKLTGSPSHSPHSSPSPSHPKPTSSRLQRIRPPPLTSSSRFAFGSGSNPMSPLPPLPTCHSSAESPISAYMRFLNNHDGLMFPPPESFENVPPPPFFAGAGGGSGGGGGGGSESFGCLPSPKLILPLSPTVSSPK